MGDGTEKHLLLLDDEPRVLRALERLLAREGYRIHSFTRPLDALQLLDTLSVGVIVSDLTLPQMDGIRFLSQASVRQPLAVQIALTAYADQIDQPRDLPAAWRCLGKPWNDDELKAAVAGAFDRHGSLREGA